MVLFSILKYEKWKIPSITFQKIREKQKTAEDFSRKNLKIRNHYDGEFQILFESLKIRENLIWSMKNGKTPLITIQEKIVKRQWTTISRKSFRRWISIFKS